MSGHNKWSKIKHKKAASDAKKSKVFGKLSRLITMEAKKADGNLDSPGLKAAIDKARGENMPNENIERAVKKALDIGGGDDERVLYEFYGPEGVAVLVEALTDNRNRTSSEVKHILNNHNIELAQPGAASWAFEKKGGGWKAKTNVDVSKQTKDKLEKIMADLEENDDVQDIFTNAKLNP